MLKRIGAEESGEFKAIASGTLPSGQPVIVNADGTVSTVVQNDPSFGSEVAWDEPTGGNVTYILSVFDSNSNKVVIAYRDGEDSNKGKALVGTVSGDSISFGSIVTCVDEIFQPWGGISFDSSNNKVVISYAGGDYAYGKSVVGTVSGTSISFGTPVVWYSGNANFVSSCFDSTANKIVISYQDAGSSDHGKAIVGTVSGTSISFGSSATFRSGSTRSTWCDYDPDNDKTLIVYRNLSNDDIEGVVSTVSGTSISFGTAVQIESGYGYTPVTVYDTTNNKFIVAYGRPTDTDAKIVVGTVSGTSISFGSATTFLDNFAEYISLVHDPDQNKIIIGYKDDGTSKNAEAKIGTVSGTSISVGSATVALEGTSRYITLAYDTSNNKTVFTYQKDRTGSTDSGNTRVFDTGGTTVTSENYIGMSRGVAVQTGSAASVGSDSVFASASTNQIASTFDSNSNRIVIAYRDAGNSNHGTAIVGTISGSSISFGSEVVFNSGNTSEISMTFYDDTNRVIIAYKDAGNSDYGTAIVGSVDSSDNSISFGTATVFESAHTTFTSIVEDSNADKVVICYNDVGNSNAGTAIVGTISGTSISFGSANTFESGNTERISTTFDSNSNKFVVAFVDADDSNKGKARVGTVSGTGTSFGTTVEFESGTVSSTTMTFDSSNNKVVIAVRASSDVGKAYVGTVSGTSISFGSAVNFTSGSNDNRLAAAVFDTSVNKVVIAFVNSNTSISAISGTVSGTSISFDDITTVKTGNNLDNLTAAFDSNANKVFIGYRDVNSSNHGTANIFTTNTVATTRGQVADGGNASIDIIGSVSDNQIGLTAGQQYFVQNDGTISTTADDPSVLAGTAISATELLVKT